MPSRALSVVTVLLCSALQTQSWQGCCSTGSKQASAGFGLFQEQFLSSRKGCSRCRERVCQEAVAETGST